MIAAIPVTILIAINRSNPNAGASDMVIIIERNPVVKTAISVPIRIQIRRLASGRKIG